MYVPLRVHGHHSMLTGVDSPAELVARAAELGLPALALVDPERELSELSRHMTTLFGTPMDRQMTLTV